MMPRIDLNCQTDTDKVNSLISDISKTLRSTIIRFDLKLTIWRWGYRRDKLGLTERQKQMIVIKKGDRGLVFNCEEASGRLREEDLSEEAFWVLLSICEYPKKFNVAAEYTGDIVFLDVNDIR